MALGQSIHSAVPYTRLVRGASDAGCCARRVRCAGESVTCMAMRPIGHRRVHVSDQPTWTDPTRQPSPDRRGGGATDRMCVSTLLAANKHARPR